MEDSPKSNPTLAYGGDETTPLVRIADVSPSAPPAYWDVAPQRDWPHHGQHVLPQQPGPSVVPGHSNLGTHTGAQLISAYPRPSYPAPHSHLPFAVTTMVICFIFNLTSLAFGITAMVFAITANTRIANGQWKQAKTMANAAFYLSIINWIYTLSIALVITGSVMGPYYATNYYYY